MTSTETPKAPPRKRAPRKAAAAPAETGPTMTHNRAEEVRAQLEAGGEQVTAGAVRRMRERAAAAADRTVAQAFATADAAKAAREAAEADVPLPEAPGVEEDPDALDREPVCCTCSSAVCAPASCRACARLAPRGLACPAAPVYESTAGVAARTARETAPRADAGDQALDDAGPDLGAAADVEAATQTSGDPGGPDDPGPSPAAPPPASADTYEADLERLAATRAAADAARAVELGGGVDEILEPYRRSVDEAELDVRSLSAIPLEAAEIDVRSLVATVRAPAPAVGPFGYPAGSLAEAAEADQWAHYTALRAEEAAGVDVVTGEVLDLEGDDPTRVRLSAEDAAAIEEARALEARAGELKEAAEAIRSRIKEKLGGEDGRGEIAVDDQGRELARWTRVTSTKCSTTALKRERPDVWAEFATTTVSRRFTWAD